MKKLKIAILVDQLTPGGVQKTAINEVKELKKLGHVVTLFVLIRLQHDDEYEDLIQDLDIVYLSDFNPLFFKRAKRIPFFTFLTHLHLLGPFFTPRYGLFKQYDFLISHGTTTCITAAAITRIFKVPYLAFIHDPLLYILEKVYSQHVLAKPLVRFIKPFARYYEKNLLLSAALIVTVSRAHQVYIQNNYAVLPAVILPGCNSKKTKIKHGRSVLGFSRWQLAKNPDFFLRLAQKLPHLTFIIAGEWPIKREFQLFQTKIQDLGLARQVKLVPRLKETDLPKLARQSFVWVHPHFEAFGMAGLEMAALGLPLIIPQGSGIAQIFEDSEAGFFPKNFDESTIIKYLSEFSTKPEKALFMGRIAAKTARRLSWGNHTKILNQQILNYNSQVKIVATINAFVSPLATGGGDRFFIELANRVPDHVHLTIVLPKIGLFHFQKAKVNKSNVRFISLLPNFFDEHETSMAIFLTYLIRAIQTSFLLPKLAPFSILHTATDVISDTIPAFLYRFNHQHVSWTARFFHFYAPPWRRQGSFMRNTGSYFLQRVSLFLFKRANMVIVDNPLLVTELSHLLGPKTKIVVSTGGVDVAAIRNTKFKVEHASTAVFIGRLSAHKGLFELLEVWKIINQQLPQAKLNVIGYAPPPEMEKIKQRVETLKLMKVITFVGFIHNRNQLYQYLRSAQLLLFLDHEAGFGLVVAEAMAAGLPVITYNLPLFGTVYRQGFITTELRNTHLVADTVLKLLHDKKSYQKLSKQAHAQARELDWKKVSQQFYQIITSDR